jgi:hypothetical protein
MNTKLNLHRYKVEHFLSKVLNNQEVKDLISQKQLFAAILLVDELYIYSTKQLNALIDAITY